MPCQQLIEQYAERINVACRRDLITADLLGAGVLGCHQPENGGCWIECLSRQLRVEDLGDAEIEKSRTPLGIHKNIAGLDVAMNNLAIMRSLNTRAHLLKHL